MIEREGSGNHGAQRVTEDEGPLDSQTIESASQKVGLRSRRPLSTVRTVAVAHTRPVERDDPMTFGRAVENATVRKILGGDDVAVQQDDGRPFTLFEVMEPDAVKVDEPTLGRVPPLHPRASYVENGRRSAAAATPRMTPERELRARGAAAVKEAGGGFCLTILSRMFSGHVRDR